MRKVLYLIIFIFLSLEINAQLTSSVKFNIFHTNSKIHDPGMGLAEIGLGIETAFVLEFKKYFSSINLSHYPLHLNSQIEKDFVDQQLLKYSIDNFIYIEDTYYDFTSDLIFHYPYSYNIIKTEVLYVGGGCFFDWYKFRFMPEIGIGISTINTWYPLNVTLKRKNSNQITTITYSPKPEAFSLAGNSSISIEYKLNKFHIYITYGLRYIESTINYTIEENDINNNTSTRTFKIYNNRLDKYFGYGIHYYFNNKR